MRRARLAPGGRGLARPGGRPPPAARGGTTLIVRDLSVQYRIEGGWLGARARLDALTAVSFELRQGEALGGVGEAGSGKSTLARAALRLLHGSGGRVVWMGRELNALPRRELRALRR